MSLELICLQTSAFSKVTFTNQWWNPRLKTDNFWRNFPINIFALKSAFQINFLKRVLFEAADCNRWISQMLANFAFTAYKYRNLIDDKHFRHSLHLSMRACMTSHHLRPISSWINLNNFDIGDHWPGSFRHQHSSLIRTQSIDVGWAYQNSTKSWN